jgi:hypothetical protein
MGATVIATYRKDRPAAEELSVRLPAAIPRMLEALTPAGRTGTPDDIAGVVEMLVRDEGNHPIPS